MSRIGARKRREQIAETKAARRLLRELYAEGVPERVETLRVPIVEAPPPTAIEPAPAPGRDLWIGAAIAGGLFLFVVLWGLLVSGCQAPNEQEIATAVDVSALTIAGGVCGSVSRSATRSTGSVAGSWARSSSVVLALFQPVIWSDGSITPEGTPSRP